MSTELIVRGVLVHDDNLLLTRNRKKGHVYLPGGHIEFAESAHAALKREMKEELGITVSIDHFLGVIEHQWVTKKRTHAEINLLFTMHSAALVSSRRPRSQETKIEFIWHPLKALSSLHLLPDVLKTVLPVWIRDNQSTRWASTY